MQLATWVISLAIARLLEPRAYGIAGMAALYVGFAQMLAELGIGAVIVQRPNLSRRIVSALTGASLVVGGLLTAVSVLVGYGLAAFYREPILVQVVAVYGLAFIPTALANMDAVSPVTSLSGHYHPIHPRAARRILGTLPEIDRSKFTFIDLGSGKGLMLLMAAEYPYAAIHGVEFSRKLHTVAERNIATYRNPRQRRFNLQSINVDAREYEFPLTPLVVCLFSRFRHELLERVLQNLDRSLEDVPRDVLVVYMYALDAYLFDRMKHLSPYPFQLVPDSKVYRSTP